MDDYYKILTEDVRFLEGLTACINCGTCTAICPAAEFYDYDPREIVNIVQSKDNLEIEKLLKTNTIWYCGECLSCKTRCPRNNTPGFIIMALRSLSQDLGFFTESEKGRQQLAIKRTVGECILKLGYCMFVDEISTEMHPEQGPVWEWVRRNPEKVYERLGGNYKGESGLLRNISQETLEELQRIFDVSGGTERFEKVEKYSKIKAEELGIKMTEGKDCDYFKFVYSNNNNTSE